MTPEQFITQLKRQDPAPAYLFVGPEAYQRDVCRKALLNKAVPEADRESGFTRVDLGETGLAAVLDDARSMSLFSTARLIWVAGAEAALPKGKAVARDSDETKGKAASAAGGLKEYLQDPPPGVVMVFDVSRYGFDRDDKDKLERVAKFYSAIPAQVEFRPYTIEKAHGLAQELARRAGLEIGPGELSLLVESLAADALRIAAEIRKLALFAGPGRKITSEDIYALVPDAKVSNIFALVEALGRGDRAGALEILDSLVKEGEYLPLALSFLESQFRYALMAREANLRGAQQIQNHFSRPGAMMYRSRAEQVAYTASRFSNQQLENAIRRIFRADRDLRDARPDDRVIMESFIFSLT